MEIKVGGRVLYLEEKTPIKKAVGALLIDRNEVTGQEIARVASIYNLNVKTLTRSYRERVKK